MEKLDFGAAIHLKYTLLFSSTCSSLKPMFAKRLQRLATFFLAALYGVAGVTGESLHYLATDIGSFWATSESSDSEVYYHVHAPDFHGHFHRHTRHGHHVHHKTVAARNNGRSAVPSLNLPGPKHPPHACPLLSLVATLKLIQVCGCTPTITLDSFIARSYEPRVALVPGALLTSYARGPPQGFFA